MSNQHTVLIGKAVKKLARLRGGGSALPGLLIEKIDSKFVERTLAQLPLGVVIISGTNGKTTTTKMVVELLTGQGLRVFTNRTGSNFARGVAAALIGEVDNQGKLSADIAVLELDEAHAVHFVKTIKPRFSLLLNVMRDQLDRFGEIDATAKLLESIALATTECIVLNREDPRVAAISQKLEPAKTSYFGLSEKVRKLFPNDDDMRSQNAKTTLNQATKASLESIDGRTGNFKIDDQDFSSELKLNGVYNIYNATAALALTSVIMAEKLDKSQLMTSLANVTPAFGRGETISIDGRACELVLVKNPAGFRLSLSSFPAENYATMIAINDNYADGRDMSWLWDVEFDSLRENGVSVVSGVRAHDMALRLQYDEVAIQHAIQDLPKALTKLLNDNPKLPVRIYCTYTAMLALRRELSKLTNVSKAIS